MQSRLQDSQPDAIETVTEEVTEHSWDRMQEMKVELGKKNFDEVIEILSKELVYRRDPIKLLDTAIPLIITGQPASGKTVTCKRLLQNFEKVFIVDVSHEYDGYDVVNIGDLLGNVWSNKAKFRIFPPDNPLYSSLEMDLTFGILLGKIKEVDSPMKEFVFVIEDAVRFTHLQNIRSFVAESRKFVRKTIVVCQDPRAYEGMGQLLKPPGEV